MKYVRIFLQFVGAVAVLGVAGCCLVGWMISRSFKSVAQEGGLRKVFDIAEASAGLALARGDVRLQAGKISGEGVLASYQRNPQALQRDKKYFETWSTALAIGHAGLESDHRLSRWENSTAVAWIASSQRTDSWGHAFCVQSDQRQTTVVSPGPQALGSFDCSTLKLPEDELAKMPQARLNPSPSGALILFVKNSSAGTEP